MLLAVAVVVAAASVTATQGCTPVVFQGHYRKDQFLPYSIYPEYHQPDPIEGGRVHLTTTLPQATNVTSVLINNQEAFNGGQDPKFTYFDWARIFFSAKTHQLGVTFHSRNTDWFRDGPQQPALNIKVTDSAGTCYTGSWTPRILPVYVSWVTQLASNEWILHVHNNGSQAQTVNSVSFDGSNNVATKPALPLQLVPEGHLVLRLNTSAPKNRGDLFTVGVTGSGWELANCGKTPERRFPVESWPRSSDCPMPGVNDTNYKDLATHGIDTIFFTKDRYRDCNPNISHFSDYINSGVGEQNNFYFWVDPQTAASIQPQHQDHAAVVFLADENDGQIDHNIPDTLNTVNQIDRNIPGALTYQGGKTNRHNGVYSGICDIQGLDFYIGACAPTIVPVVGDLHITASYAYIRNARNNQMPLPAMTYSQLYGGWSYQPSGQEISLQMAYVLLSGAKGMTLFQTVHEIFEQQASDWNGVVKDTLLSMTNPVVREVLRTGDIDAMPTVSSDTGNPIAKISSLSTVVRNHEYLLVIAANTDAHGYSNLLCHVYANRHWDFKDHTISKLTMTATPDMQLASIDAGQLKEVKGGSLVSATGVSLKVTGSALEFTDLELKQDTPLRMFLLPYKQ